MGAYKVSYSDAECGPASEPGADEKETEEQKTEKEKKLENGFV